MTGKSFRLDGCDRVGQLCQLKTVEQCLVDTIGDATSECGGVVVLLDFPDRDRVDPFWEGAVDAPRGVRNGT